MLNQGVSRPQEKIVTAAACAMIRATEPIVRAHSPAACRASSADCRRTAQLAVRLTLRAE